MTNVKKKKKKGVENLRKHERRKVFPSFLSFFLAVYRKGWTREEEFSPRIRSLRGSRANSIPLQHRRSNENSTEDSFVQPERTIELCTYWSNTCVNWYNACKEILRDSFFSPDINVISFDKITKNKRISMDQF